MTVLTNTRCDLTSLSRFDFVKISTKRTREILQWDSQMRVCVSEISENHLEEEGWNKYKKKVMGGLFIPKLN